MPKAITTRFYGATPTKPARVVARAEGVKPLTYPADRALTDDVHRLAAEALRDRMGWTGAMVAGALPDAKTNAFVFCDAVDVLRDVMGFLDVGDVRAVWAKKGETQALTRVLNKARLISRNAA